MQLNYTIAYDVAGVIIIAVLFAIFHTQYQRSEGRNLVFKSFLLSGILCGILDILTIFTITFSHSVPVTLNSLLIMLYHIAFSTFSFCGTNYVYTFLKSNALAGQILDGIVSAVFLLLYFINQFNGMIFSFSNGEFVRGPFYLLYCIPAAWYLFHAAFVLGVKKRVIDKKKYYIYTAFVLIPLLFGFIQGAFLPHDRMVFFAGTVSALIMFFSLETEEYRELKVTMRELEISRENEIKANNAKSSFLAKMSHEIRTPINAILGMNTMILRDSRDSNIRDYSKNIENSGKSLLSLINNILDFSKIESGKMELVESEYPLISVINDCYHMIFLRAQEKGLELEINVSDDISRYILYGDEVRIKQIITNLLTNAVKYTPEGRVSLNVGGERDDDSLILVISVADTGSGIAKEDQGKLFNAYERVDEEKNKFIEGTGLGLQITSSFAAMMGGSVGVESEPGKGSIFTVRIPQRIIGISEQEIVEADGSLRGIKDRGERDYIAPDAHILVVDDVDMNIKVIQGFLKPNKIKISTAKSGAECLTVVEFEQFDVIFLDHMMPVMDGLETFEKLKEKYGDRLPPVIMMTANAVLGAKEEYLSKGFSDYVSKPVMIDELKSVLIKYLPRDKVRIVEKEEADTDKQDGDWILKIDFLNTAAGLDYCAGDKDFYLEMLKEFVEADRMGEMQSYFTSDDWENYRIQVHALKSTSKSIGAEELSEKALFLEMAAKEGRIMDIRHHHGDCMMAYGKLLNQLKGMLAGMKQESGGF